MRSNQMFIDTATSGDFEWKPVTAQAFYGTREDVEKYFQPTCTSTKGKLQIAADTQTPTKNTLIRKNFTAYELIYFRESELASEKSRVYAIEESITKKEYIESLIRHTGLFAIHECISKQINLFGLNNAICKTQIEIHTKILSALQNDSQDKLIAVLTNEIPLTCFPMKIYKLAASSGIISNKMFERNLHTLAHNQITELESEFPLELLSTEFRELITAFITLPYEDIKKHFNEYKNHIISLNGYDLVLVLEADYNDTFRNTHKNCPILISMLDGAYKLFGNKQGVWQETILDNFIFPREWENSTMVFVSPVIDKNIFSILSEGHTHSIRELDKICFEKLHYTKQISAFYNCGKNPLSLFSILPREILNLIGEDINALEIRDAAKNRIK